MKKNLLTLLIVFIGLPLGLLLILHGALFMAFGFDIHFLAIEACMDGGVGCWDDVDNVCRTRYDEQALCHRERTLGIFPE